MGQRDEIERALILGNGSRDLFEQAPVGLYRMTRGGEIVDVNVAAVEILGYPDKQTLLQENSGRLYVDSEAEREFQQELERQGFVHAFERRVRRYDGSVIWVRESAQLVADGGFGSYEGSLEYLGPDEPGRAPSDLRKRCHELEEALRESRESYRALVESASDLVFAADADGKLQSVNPVGLRILGRSEEDVVGLSFHDMVRTDYKDDARRFFARQCENRTASTYYEFPILTKDLREIWLGLTTELRVRDGKIVGFHGVAREITERKRLERQLEHMASRDPLTNLFNRQRFEEALEHHLALVQRYGTQGALLWIDLDGFKEINDSLGHQAGDTILVNLAEVMRKRFRTADIVARLAGDEFAILLAHSDGRQAEMVAERFLEELRRHTTQVNDQTLTMTASIGIAIIPEHGMTSEELLNRADLAMHQAKEEGRNRFAVFSFDRDWKTQPMSRISWAQRLRESLEKERFLLYAQPILQLDADRVSGFELLLRLQDELGEIVLPGAFLDVAERYGLIRDIDQWVVRQAVGLLAEHGNGRELSLEVNISSKSITDRTLLEVIRKEVASSGIEPRRLILEITESAAIANITEAQKFIETLKGLGCQFALDDFGVGFSSFYHLKHLPVDYLKIDGSFIRDLHNDPVDQRLVKAIVEVAASLGKRTIAEFVENEDTMVLLGQYGVDYAQGYHIGWPVPVSEALRLKRKRRSR